MKRSRFTEEQIIAVPREPEELDPTTKLEERLMLGLRLDEPVPLSDVAAVVDPVALARLERLGLASRTSVGIALTDRGRFVGDAVTAALSI